MPGKFLWLVLILMLVAFNGCAGLSGYPRRSIDEQVELEGLRERYGITALKEYDGLKSDPTAQQRWRNEAVNGRLAMIDLQFNMFKQALAQENTIGSIATDVATLGLNAAGTLVGGATTKAILAASSGGLIGAKSSFDKHAYFERTIPALIAKMEALRKEVLVRIYSGSSQSTADYPLTAALVDLEDYYYAGTIPGAIAGITARAGEDIKKANDKLEDIRILRLADFPVIKSVRDRVEALANKIKQLGDTEAIQLAQNPPVPLADPDVKAGFDRLVAGRPWQSDPNLARTALIFMVTRGPRDEAALTAWEKRLP